MKKLLQTALFILLVVGGSTLQAQSVRYIDEVFADVQVDTSITYAQNYGYYSGFATLESLVMDVYTPVGDTASKRPVILLSHNGSFLPEAFTHGLLGLCFNGRKDSSVVELCKRFAKRGYIAVSYDYRLGWNATAGDLTTRTKTIIQAVYRAMQDAKSCVRYFRNDVINGSNQWKADTSRFVIGGSNSGAYVALAAGSLNDVSELNNIKFVDVNGSFIKQDTLGDFDGFGGYQNYDNYTGISSRFNAVLALGGAVGDTSWIQAGEVPVIAFHGVNESSTQYNTALVNTASGQPVIEVSGSGDFMPIVEALGNNNAFKPNNFLQGPPNRNGLGNQTVTIEGLYPFYGQKFEPWNWFDTACYNSSSRMIALTGGDASIEKGNRYIDTIMAYSAPRLYKLLYDPNYGTTGINETAKHIDMSMFPNPANTQLNIVISMEQKPISSIFITDLTGRVVKEITGINAHTQNINLTDLSSGVYLTSIKLTDASVVTRKVIVQK